MRALLLALALCLPVSTAQAGTDSLSSTGPITAIQVASWNRIYGLTTAGSVIYRRADTRMWTRVSNPSGVSFYLSSGVAGATPPMAWGYARVFAISAPAGATPATLYELSPGGGWRSLGAPPGASLSNAPSIAATFGDNRVWVGVRTNDNHVWTCRLLTSGSSCAWEDETCRGGPCHLAAATSPIEVAIDPANNRLDVLTITSSGILQRYNWQLDTWTNLPSLPSPWFVDTTDIAATYVSGDLRILVAAWDDASPADRLYVARSTNNGTSWAWTRLQASILGDPPSGVNWRRFSLHQAASSTNTAAFFSSGDMTQSWTCIEPTLTAGGTVTCTAPPGGANGGMPSELLAGRDVIGPANYGTADFNGTIKTYHHYVVGALTTVRYLYDFESTEAGGMGKTWHNLLTARDTVSLAGLSAEFSGAARFGDVMLLGCQFGMRSLDDGNTWAGPTTIFSSSSCDTSVGYDSAGNLYATNVSLPNVQVARATGTSTWTAPITIPPTAGILADRPWMTTDKLRANYLYLVRSASSTNGRIAYCNGTATCDNASAWCPASASTNWALPSRTGCFGYRGAPGCWVEQSGDGTVWVTVQDDTSCDPIPTGYTASVGVRRITNLASLGASCTQPTLSSPECLYVVHRAPSPSTQLNGGASSPGDNRRWGSRLAVAGDSSRIMMTFQAYRDLSGGGPCLASSTRCRSDILTVSRTSANGWCANGGCRWTDVRHPNMWLANWDNSPLSNLPWVDHFIPASMLFDYRIIANTWYDFRGDPTNDTSYRVYDEAIRYTPTDEVYGSVEYPSATVATFNSSVWYGDIDTTAQSRLHTFIPRQVSVGGASNLIGYLWAPQAPHAF